MPRQSACIAGRLPAAAADAGERETPSGSKAADAEAAWLTQVRRVRERALHLRLHPVVDASPTTRPSGSSRADGTDSGFDPSGRAIDDYLAESEKLSDLMRALAHDGQLTAAR